MGPLGLERVPWAETKNWRHLRLDGLKRDAGDTFPTCKPTNLGGFHTLVLVLV